MSKTLLLLSTLFILFGVNAQSLNVKNSGNVYDMDGNKWTPKEVHDILADNPQALASYTKGRSKKTWGNILLYSGLAMATTNIAIGFKTEAVIEQYNFAPTIIGVAMALIAVPVKIGHTKKVKKAIELHNSKNNNQVNIQTPKITFTASQNQGGLLIEF